MRLTHSSPSIAKRPGTQAPNTAAEKGPSSKRANLDTPAELTGPLADLAIKKAPTRCLSEMPATVLDRIAFHLETPALRRLSRACPGNGVLHRLTERRDAAAIAALVEGLPQSLDPSEGVELIHAAIAGQTDARQAEILAECATHLRSLRALPIVRQKALDALLAAAEKIRTERPAALEAAVISLTAEGLLGGQRFKALINKARALPDEYRGKTIATIGVQLLRADSLHSPLMLLSRPFLEAAAEVESHRPELLESLVEAAQTGGHALADREKDLLAAAKGRPAAALLESLLIAEREGRPQDDRQHQFELFAADGDLYAMLLKVRQQTADEIRQALLAREENLLVEGGSLRTSLLEGRISCREIAAEHGIVVDHLHKLAWSAAKSRVRDGENLVDVLQTVDISAFSLRVKLSDIALNNAQRAIRKNEEPASVIERLGIHNPDDITQLIRYAVEHLRAQSATTVAEFMQKLDFQDSRYKRLAAKCVEDLVD